MPLTVATALGAGIWIGNRFVNSTFNDSSSDKIGTIMGLIESDYVDDVDIDSLIEASIPDILSKLDPHTSYIPSESLQSVNEELEGSFCGIGIQFNMLTDTIKVLEVISGGPSEKVGLLPGDRIITINDSLAAGQKWPQEKVLKTLRGERDTKVKLGIQRSNSPELFTYEVTRGEIPVTSIDASYLMNDSIGYIKVNKFGRTTYSEFLNSLVDLKSKGATKYMIDLRSNTGGFMEMAILMANEFLPTGQPIVATHGRTSYSETSVGSDGSGSFQNEDIIVLLDEYSASASEIFAGAIQDNDRGLIVGRRSFGKGLVQRQIELSDSSAIRLTTGRYYTPSGRCIQKEYTRGAIDAYDNEINSRYQHGEGFSRDSVKLDTTQTYHTLGGRPVYGGGGIMPDIYVPNDTTGLTSYYIKVLNAGLLHKFAFDFADANRDQLKEAKSADELISLLPNEDSLLYSFATYANANGNIAPHWYYINISRNLIVNLLKALIARDILGSSEYYKVLNQSDATIDRALQEFNEGNAKYPIAVTDN